MESILAIDVGGGTQDILLYQPGINMENNTKLVLPSPTQIAAEKIKNATQDRKDLFIHGYLMGGGPTSRAIKEHLREGLHVYATRSAALTVKDDLHKVAAEGVKIVDHPPAGCASIEFRDVNLQSLKQALEPFGIVLPSTIAVAVQDHGHSPQGSNRQFRFSHWEQFLSHGGHLSDLLYDKNNLPDYFTRMKAVMESCREQAKKIWLMDTGAAAIMGAMEDPRVHKAVKEQGSLLVNVGNQHTIAFLTAGNRVFGVFEHHTGLLTEEKLLDYLQRFKKGSLSHQEVFQDQGHGCAIQEEAGNFSFDFTAVTGPRRGLASNLGYLAVPHGDMMLSGAFGLVRMSNTE